MNIRHVDHYHKDWIADSVALSLAERGLDETAFNLVCNLGGPVRQDHLRKTCPGDRRIYNRALGRLLELGKLVDVDGTHFAHPRAEAALEHARKRIGTATQNRPKSDATATKNDHKSEHVSGKNNGLGQTDQLYARDTTFYQLEQGSERANALSAAGRRSEPIDFSPPGDRKKPVYDLGRKVLGTSSGGQITKLIQHYGGSLDGTVRALQSAAARADAREYVGAILRGETRTGDVLAETDRLYRELGVS